jgi:hypothetical protein
MCRVKNLTNTSQDFDSWFANLKAEDGNKLPVFDEQFDFQELLAPLPMFEPEYTPVKVETVMYPSPTPSYPSPPPSLAPQNTKTLAPSFEESSAKKRQRQNEAAKRCRQKKLTLIQQSQEQTKKFEQEKFEMSIRLAVLEKEKQAWLARERDMQQQLDILKRQLDESHMIIISMKPN